MLLISYIRENHEEIVQRMKVRNTDIEYILEKILALDKLKREALKRYENNQHAIHLSSNEIGGLFKAGKKEEGNALREKAGSLKEENKLLHEEVNRLEDELLGFMYQIPNLPHESIPPGKDDGDNIEIELWGEKPVLLQKKEHWVLAREYDIIDWELGVKITGAGFPVYRGKGAKLQRALVQFFLDEADDNGYEEINPPLLINEASGYGTGQLPDKDGQMYHTERDHLYLIPTAEVPLTNIYRDTLVKESDFPIKNVAFSPCFRREAGSYGKDVRGLNRVHQFEKVEIVQIVHPNNSFEVLEEMVNHVKGLLEKLGLHYRVVRLCGGDLGFASSLTFDFEVWSAAQELWLEVSSVSNFASFQANRMKCRYKDENGKTQLVHTLNGSAMALPRIMASIMENYQTEEGIKVPECLQKYLRFDTIN